MTLEASKIVNVIALKKLERDAGGRPLTFFLIPFCSGRSAANSVEELPEIEQHRRKCQRERPDCSIFHRTIKKFDQYEGVAFLAIRRKI
ncbi:hypothetical protein QN224_13560 [Sinorhizobium sp. 8-89]|uniref:hypothetical protein n=1 Tax=Sinorhizobium sp. 7-81 TaxID=3049087 RepID=UPI0024C2A64D|nr:hypothetical protein [Sinorhizobium sp. 7-81]MDK1386434.1 hypothetical protein [Sinorhizobium sp. 7-81]